MTWAVVRGVVVSVSAGAVLVEVGRLVDVGVDEVGVTEGAGVEVKESVSVGRGVGAGSVSVGGAAGTRNVGVAGINVVVEHARTNKPITERIR